MVEEADPLKKAYELLGVEGKSQKEVDEAFAKVTGEIKNKHQGKGVEAAAQSGQEMKELTNAKNAIYKEHGFGQQQSKAAQPAKAKAGWSFPLYNLTTNLATKVVKSFVKPAPSTQVKPDPALVEAAPSGPNPLVSTKSLVEKYAKPPMRQHFESGQAMNNVGSAVPDARSPDTKGKGMVK